jgi:hypothetical protein
MNRGHPALPRGNPPVRATTIAAGVAAGIATAEIFLIEKGGCDAILTAPSANRVPAVASEDQKRCHHDPGFNALIQIAGPLTR